MIIKSIQLKEFRKFNEAVKVSGIEKGLNVLSAINEFGKSTIVDALYAVLFENHRTFSKDIKKLVPSAGGNPQVKLEIEIDTKTYLVEKNWSNRQENKKAYIYENSELIAVDDQVENWIFEKLKFSEKNAPTGLIWLRQGNVSYGKWEDTYEERKSLLSSITGEIENLTGGQTMDRLVKNYEVELAKYITKTGQKKTASQYHVKSGKIESLNADLLDHEKKYNDLKEHIKKRNELKIKLANNDNPEEDKSNNEKLLTATNQLAEAEQLENKINVIKQKEELQVQKIKNIEDNISTLETKIKEEKDAKNTFTEFKKTHEGLTEDRDKEIKNNEQLTKKFENSQKQLSKIEQALNYKINSKRQKEIETDLKKIKGIKDEISSLKKQLNSQIDEKAFNKIKDLYEDLKLEKSVQERSSISLSFNYDIGKNDKISIDGEIQHDKQKYLISKDNVKIDIKGIGSIDLKSSQNKDHTSIKILEDNLTKELSTHKIKDYDAALKSFKSNQEIINKIKEYEIDIKMIAPNGEQTLNEELSNIPEFENESDFGEYSELNKKDLEDKFNLAKIEFDKKEKEKNKSDNNLKELIKSIEVNKAKIDITTTSLTKAEQSLSNFEKTYGDLNHLENNLNDEKSKLNKIKLSLKEAEGNINFDINKAKAEYSRIKGVIENKKKQLDIDTKELIKIDSLIKGMSGDGIHEKIIEIKEEIGSLQRDVEVIEYEIKVLIKLIDVLKDARSNARDAYLEPIIRELKPLLKLIWRESDINFNDNYAPTIISRQGKEEPIEHLSLGTQEQISIFVRLAFAKLFSYTHSSIPVIIDDAIIYSDDIRIKEIFTALHMQSSNYQIIVFSCRQKSFEELGGNLLSLEKVN